jgi:hypothetical protein
VRAAFLVPGRWACGWFLVTPLWQDQSRYILWQPPLKRGRGHFRDLGIQLSIFALLSLGRKFFFLFNVEIIKECIALLFLEQSLVRRWKSTSEPDMASRHSKARADSACTFQSALALLGQRYLPCFRSRMPSWIRDHPVRRMSRQACVSFPTRKEARLKRPLDAASYRNSYLREVLANKVRQPHISSFDAR